MFLGILGVSDFINKIPNINMSVPLPTLDPISFLMASLANYTLRSSCHNRAMIVGDGQGLVKTKVVDREKDLTAKQDCLFESESVEA